MLKMAPSVRSMDSALTNAMVDVYLASQEHFTQDDQPHYVYSPRELTRWVRGISEAIAPMDSITPNELLRLWAHEGLRLFQDRLVSEEERIWTDELVDGTAEKYFNGSCDVSTSLKRPLLYSCWMSKDYVPVTRDELKDYVSARLKVWFTVILVLFTFYIRDSTKKNSMWSWFCSTRCSTTFFASTESTANHKVIYC